MSIKLKIWSLEHTKGFSKIWPSDQVFDPTWPIFVFVQDFIKKKVLTKFHDHLTENAYAPEATSHTDNHETIGQNVCLAQILDEFENWSCWVKN